MFATRFERATFRLGELMNVCHTCSPMYKKVSIHQAFFVFRVAFGSSKFIFVVRCSPLHFSSFLDFAKKENKNVFHLSPILAVLGRFSCPFPKRGFTGEDDRKREYCIPGSNRSRVYNTLYVSGGPIDSALILIHVFCQACQQCSHFRVAEDLCQKGRVDIG